ncbi:MAG: hypothetical protein WA982_11430 [Rubrobacteraceae bacterium]
MSSPRNSTNDALQLGVILLTIGTALIHLQLNFPDPVFILNGLGYLALLAALYLPFPQLEGRRYTIRWALIGFTAVTIFLWILFGARTPIGYIDKLIEAALIALLLLESRRSG